jgi:hypothetical protein
MTFLSVSKSWQQSMFADYTFTVVGHQSVFTSRPGDGRQTPVAATAIGPRLAGRSAEMGEYEETYYGHRIKVLTSRGADGNWHSTGKLTDSEETIANSDGHGSEEDARRAALSAVMAELDRRRAQSGKP